MVTSGVIHVTFILHLICSLPELYGWCLMAVRDDEADGGGQSGGALHFVLLLMWILGLLVETVLLAFADKRCEEEMAKSEHAPELHCSFLNRLLLWWLNPLIILGSRKNLDVEDLFELNYRMTSAHLVPLWEHYWRPTFESG